MNNQPNQDFWDKLEVILRIVNILSILLPDNINLVHVVLCVLLGLILIIWLFNLIRLLNPERERLRVELMPQIWLGDSERWDRITYKVGVQILVGSKHPVDSKRWPADTRLTLLEKEEFIRRWRFDNIRDPKGHYYVTVHPTLGDRLAIVRNNQIAHASPEIFKAVKRLTGQSIR